MAGTTEFKWTEALALAHAMRDDVAAMHAEVVEQFDDIQQRLQRVANLMDETHSGLAAVQRRMACCTASLDRIDAGLERVENDLDRRDE